MPYCPICQKCLCKPVKARPDKKQETQQLRKYRGNFAKLEGQFPNDAKYGGGIISSKCGHLFHQNCLHEYITTYRTKGDCYGTTYNVLCPICGQNLCCGKMLKIDIEAHFGILEEFFQDLYKLKYMNKELKRTLELEWSDIADLEKKIESTKEEYERYKATKKTAEERCAAMEQRVAKAIEDANTCFRYREVEKQLLDENINLEAVARRMETMISARCQPEYFSTSKSSTSISSDSDSSIQNVGNRSDEGVSIISCDSIEDIHRRAAQTASQVDISVQISVHSEWSGESRGSVNCELVSIRHSAGRRHSECTLTSHGASDGDRQNEYNLVTVRKVSSTQVLCHGRGNAHSIQRTGQWAIEQISQELVRAQRMHYQQHAIRDAGEQLHQNRFQQKENSNGRYHCNEIKMQEPEDQSKQEEVGHEQNVLAVIPVHQTVQYNQRKAKLEAFSASLPPGIIKSRSYTVRSYNSIVQPILNVNEAFETTIEAVTSGQNTEVSPSLMKKRSYTIKVHGSSNVPHEPSQSEKNRPPSEPIITEVTDEETAPTKTENDGTDEVTLHEPQKSDCQADLVDFLVVSCNESDEGKPPSGKPTLTDIQLEEVASKLQDIAEGRAPQTKKHLKRRSTKVEIQSLLLPQQTKPEPAKLSVAAQPLLQVKEFAVKPGPRQRPPQVPASKTEQRLQRKNAPPKPATKTTVPPVAFTVKIDSRPPLQAPNNQRKSPPKEVPKSIPKPPAQVPSRATAKPEKSVPTRLPLAQSRKKLPPVPPSKPSKNSRSCPSKSQEKGFNLDLSQLPPPPTPHLFGSMDISDLIVPPPPPLSVPFLNLEELPKPVPPPPPMTPKFDRPQTLIGKTPESTRRNLQILLHENSSTSELQKPCRKSMDSIKIVQPPPPALGLFNNDSNDELLKTILSQSSWQTESSTTTESGAAGDTGKNDAPAAPPTHAHPELVPTVVSKTSSNMAAPSKCLAAERFASSLKQQQSHSTILDNSSYNLSSTLPQQRYVCYGYKPDGIRLSNEPMTLPPYCSAGSSHPVKFNNYQNMPITPIVIETNSSRVDDKDSGGSSISMGSHGFNCIASNDSNSSCAEKYFFNGATNNYALASLLSQQSCQNFYRNLHKSPRFPP